MQDLKTMSVSQLKEMAKTLRLKGYEKMKKKEVFELVNNYLNPDGIEMAAPAEKPEKKKPGRKPKAKAEEAVAAPAEKSEKKKPGRKPKIKGEETANEQTPADAPEQKKRGRKPKINVEESANEQTLVEAPEQPLESQKPAEYDPELDSGMVANGLLEIMPDGFGFIRAENFMPSEADVYVAPSMIRKFRLRMGDILEGPIRVKKATEKFAALLRLDKVNGYEPEDAANRPKFENLTPIFPDERIHLERDGSNLAMRVVDLIAPIGKGQRGMIVSPPKAGKTTLIKSIAKAVTTNHPAIKLIILLIDERPEEVTDIKESITGSNVEVVYSTFDELPEHHKRVSEMTINHAKRLVEHGEDVMILLDSITRLSRAYNLVITPSGRTLSGGLDPAALYSPKSFFGAARNMREGGSLTILATALVDTGSRMDDMIFEEFKGTGNMELVLDRKLSERRIFPAIDLLKSGTRRDDLLLSHEEYTTMDRTRKQVSGLKPEEATETILDLFLRTRNNRDLLYLAHKML